ncbi:hypothetical protein LRR80_06592 [Streptomyces sp. RO-S4]|uniref:hypothetical protein n=1 Tax=Streptomyces sp. RO-S4 TaxID=2902486 RepID=UPI00208F5472|nr:hypothetical protein [Streptomyces sp. RO-S4]MCO4700482.1 hypothetical protein [Streptomyces sp. RO-S4]
MVDGVQGAAMRHKPIFRWVVAAGLLLVVLGFVVWETGPEYPELEQVEFTVLEEEPDGTCAVRWTDPYDAGQRTGPYRCDPDRDPLLKDTSASDWGPPGWDTGFVVAEGDLKGELYDPDMDAAADRAVEVSDALTVSGVLVTFAGLVCGGVRTLIRLVGLTVWAPLTVRRAERLREAARGVVREHERAVGAVRDAWQPLHDARVREELAAVPVGRLRWSSVPLLPVAELQRHGFRTVRDVLDAGAWGLADTAGLGRRTAEKVWSSARRRADDVGEDTWVRLGADLAGPEADRLLTALRVLVQAGPEARSAVEEAGRLVPELDRHLLTALPASRLRLLFGADRERRADARVAVRRLREMVAEAERSGRWLRFLQTSIDLLRGADTDPLALAARVDLASRPDAYQEQLWHIVRTRPALTR